MTAQRNCRPKISRKNWQTKTQSSHFSRNVSCNIQPILSLIASYRNAMHMQHKYDKITAINEIFCLLVGGFQFMTSAGKLEYVFCYAKSRWIYPTPSRVYTMVSDFYFFNHRFEEIVFFQKVEDLKLKYQQWRFGSIS